MSLSRSSGAGLGLLGWVLVLPLMAGAVYWPYTQGDFVLAGVAAFVSFAAILGHRAGAAKIIGFIVGGAVGAFYAPELTKSLEPLLKTVVQKEGIAIQLAGYGVSIVAGAFIGSLVFQIVASILSAGSPFLDITNSRIGFLLGGAQGMALAIFLVSSTFTIEPIARRRLSVPAEQDTQKLGREIASKVVYVSESVRQKPYGKLLMSVNPFERFETLKKISQSIATLSDPSALEKMLQGNNAQSLAQSPDVQNAVQQISNDPQLRQMLTSGQGLSPQNLSALMSNPTVQKLMQDPKLMDQLMSSMPK